MKVYSLANVVSGEWQAFFQNLRTEHAKSSKGRGIISLSSQHNEFCLPHIVYIVMCILYRVCAFCSSFKMFQSLLPDRMLSTAEFLLTSDKLGKIECRTIECRRRSDCLHGLQIAHGQNISLPIEL